MFKKKKRQTGDIIVQLFGNNIEEQKLQQLIYSIQKSALVKFPIC